MTYRCGAFEAAHIAIRRSNIRNPHPEYNPMNGLRSVWFRTIVKPQAVCRGSNRPPAKRNTAPHCAARRGIRFNGRRNEKAPPHRNGGAL